MSWVNFFFSQISQCELGKFFFSQIFFSYVTDFPSKKKFFFWPLRLKILANRQLFYFELLTKYICHFVMKKFNEAKAVYQVLDKFVSDPEVKRVRRTFVDPQNRIIRAGVNYLERKFTRNPRRRTLPYNRAPSKRQFHSDNTYSARTRSGAPPPPPPGGYTSYTPTNQSDMSSSSRYIRSRRSKSRRRPYQSGSKRLAANPVKGKHSQQGSKRKRTKYCGQAELCREVGKLKNALTELKTTSDESVGIMRYRKIGSQQMTGAFGGQNSVFISTSTQADMNSYMDQLRYWDPAAAAFAAAAGPPANQQCDTNLDSLTQSLDFRNNCGVDIHVKVYLCQVKQDTDNTALLSWSNGINQAVFPNPQTPQSLNTYPTDVDQVNDTWKLSVAFDGNLTPGQTGKVKHTAKHASVNYVADLQTAKNYQKSFKSFGFLVITTGTISHDDAPNTGRVNLGGHILDIIVNTTAVVKYDSGCKTEYVYLENSLPAMTTNGFQSQKAANLPQIAALLKPAAATPISTY